MGRKRKKALDRAIHVIAFFKIGLSTHWVFYAQFLTETTLKMQKKKRNEQKVNERLWRKNTLETLKKLNN